MLSATAAVVGMTVPTLIGAPSGAQALQNLCPAATTLDKLCVESSSNGTTTAPYATTILKHDRITEFKWLLNEDDSTGDPSFTADNVASCLPARAAVNQATALANPALAIYEHAGTKPLTDCPWPSVHSSSGHSTVIASGNQDDVGALANIAALGDHKYLISVTAANYKIDGIHFAVKGGALYSVNEEVGAPFVVRMNPLPKKTATIRVHVFNDNASTNGQWDGQTETLVTCADATRQQVAANCGGSTDPNLVADPSTDMSGFSVHINDVLAETTTDVYGNPLCTQYETDANGNVLLNNDGTPNPVVFNDPNIPTGTAISNVIPQAGGASGSDLAGTQSTCLSDHYGDIVIPNMGPNRYAVTVVPPDPRTHNGDKWVQTTTLEGGHDWDSWNIEGNAGYDTELIVGGERVTPVTAGFVKLTHPDQVWNDAENAGVGSAAEQAYYDASSGFLGGSGNGEIKGRVMIGRAYIGSGGASPLAGTNLANAKEDGPIKDGLISISCIATCNAPTDSTVWTGRARSDGTFDVNHLQTGDYTVAFWDETQDYILAVMQYHVTSSTNPTVTVQSATVPLGVPTVAFSANAGLVVGDIVFFTSGDPLWDGNFAVKSVSADGRTVTLQAVSGANPTAAPSAANLPTVNVTNVADILLPGWFTSLKGTVFNDLNGDGIHQTNEPGIPDFVLTERTRGNSLQDQGVTVAKTNDEGQYDLSEGYPLGQFLIAEAYNPRFKNTGYTYTTENDPMSHTVVSSQVDVNFLPVIGLSATLDWGVQAYGTGHDYWSGLANPAPKDENGGIVGTVSYDVTRNEFDPAYSAQEDYQPGVAGIPMQLWKTHKTDGVNADVYPDSKAVQQWGIEPSGSECMRADASRGSNAVTDASQTCKPYDYYVTESWQRPVGCKALDINGNQLAGELALPDAPATVDYSHNPDNLTATSTIAEKSDCVEAPMSGLQIGGNGTVDGNYALTSLIKPATLAAAGNSDLEQVYADSQNNPVASDPLVSGDYVVEAVNPVDTINPQAVKDPTIGGYIPAGGAAKRLYRFTDETSINVMSGDTYVPQDGYTQHDPAPDGGGYSLTVTPQSPIRYDSNSLGAGTVAKCAGTRWTVPAVSAQPADLAAAGGNPYAGRSVPVCDAKLVTVAGGRSMNPGFFIYADVPVPSKFYGLVNDDLNVNVDRRSVLLGEVAPAPNVPVGIYDENGNWKLTAHSDVNGFYEALLPSIDTYNCPLPAGPCANMYRLVGNDPGTLDHRNLDYNPNFRTIATEFQAWTGVVHPVDQAPTHNGITIEGPAAQFGALSLCRLSDVNPTLFAIDKPYYDPDADASHNFVIKGSGFGVTPGTLKLSTTTVPVTAANWTDTQITFTVPTSLIPGPYQLSITNSASGLSTVNGLTFHRLSSAAGTATYLRRTDVYEVKPGADPTTDTDNPGGRIYTPVHDAWDMATNTPIGFFGTDVNGRTVGTPNNVVNAPNGRAIQRAVQAAYNSSNKGAKAKLVVIYPNTAANYAPHNPFAAYFENVLLHGKVKLQGVGPGGATGSNSIVPGTNIDASQFWSATQVVPPGGNQNTADGSYSDDWRTFADGIARVGSTADSEIPEGAAVTAIAQSQNQYGGEAPSGTTLFRSGVDGILLTGGDQQGNPGNINTLPGARSASTPQKTNPGPAQGGAIMTDQYVRDFNITNNQIQSNGGTYGTVRIGTPDLPGTANATSNHNERLNVANNRIVANAGTNLAGALGIFAGASNYTVTGNDFCGNFSAEYGGAISHYGMSADGNISRNRIYYNQGYDEGGGIMIAGALPANNSTLSFGAGAVTIDSNTLISNQSNDDGGGIRFLMAGNFPELVENNVIANNLSTHEGGGVALDDAPNVTLVNNTIVKNVTTATAATNAAIGSGATAVKPANPAGLSTGGNSALLQASIGGTSVANWSKPKLLNNIFADNRAGWAILPTAVNFNQSAIHGVGDPLDSDPIQRWDIGVSSPAGLDNGNGAAFGFDGLDNTTNARDTSGLVHAGAGASYLDPATNIDPSVDGTNASLGGIGFVNAQDFLVDSLMWRNNTNMSFPVIVSHMVPVNLLADYHLTPTSNATYAIDAGAPSYTSIQPAATVTAPNHDIDNESRPAGAAFDRGADELAVYVDFDISKTASSATVNAGSSFSYTINVTNHGPATGAATVTDVLPPALSGTSWTCTASGGATCPAGPIPAGNLGQNVTLPVGGTATFVLTATVANTATAGPLSNTASVEPAPGSGVTDTNSANNSSTANVAVQVSGNLQVAVSGPGAKVTRAQILPYVITVTNTGATTMQESFSSSHSGSFVGGGGWTCAVTGATSSCGESSGSGDIAARVITVAGGGTVTFTYSTATASGFPVGWAVPNSAPIGSPMSVTGTLNANVAGFTDTNAVDNVATLPSTVVSRLNLSLSNAFSTVGTARRFTVAVSNIGGADAATGVGLSDPVPAGISFSWSCASSSGSNLTNCGGTTTGSGPISRILVVPSGATVTFTITATRSPSGAAAPVTNTATATEPANSIQSAVTNSPASATGTI